MRILSHFSGWAGLVLLPTFLFLGCRQHHFLLKREVIYQPVDSTAGQDSAVINQISPYKAQLINQMSAIVGRAEKALEKAQPESALGNWVADIIAAQVAAATSQRVDLAFMNYGGLRIGSLPAGQWSKGLIFELLPFDNALVLVELQGDALSELLQFIAQKGGLPVSAGLRSKLKDGNLTELLINGQPLDKSKTYRIATIDYLANGGDNCKALAGKKQTETGLLLRDAVLNHLDKDKSPQTAQIEGRIRP